MRRKAEDVTTGPASVSKYFKNNLIQDKLPALVNFHLHSTVKFTQS
uniref:Uncharacterized protein n=1 Tax=Tetraselmis sp. GSL018 TaxID=582737 RepID=A0A061RUA4_9CHLO